MEEEEEDSMDDSRVNKNLFKIPSDRLTHKKNFLLG